MDNQTAAARPFLLEIACPDAAVVALTLELPAPARAGGWQRRSGEFEMPAGCPGQVMRLRYHTRSLQERMVSGTLRLDAMRLNPLGNQAPR